MLCWTGVPAKRQSQRDQRPRAAHLRAHLREVRRMHCVPSIPAIVLIQVHYVHTLAVEAVVLHFRLTSRYPNLSHAWAVLCLDCKEIWLASRQPYFPNNIQAPLIVSLARDLQCGKAFKQESLLNGERIFPGQSYTDTSFRSFT